jgi:hypothetical protein
MSYVVGSEVEAMAFTDHGVEYRPDGPLHAVDTQSMSGAPQSLLGYALCGTAVRVWPDHPFDPTAPPAHNQCAAIAAEASSNERPR